MGAGFNVTIINNIKGLDLYIDNCSTNCMYNLAGIFSAKKITSGSRLGGYCEAKGSGGCAFEVSTYSFDVKVIEFDNNEPKHLKLTTISGKPGSGRSDDGFSTMTTVADANYLITRTMAPDDNPSFTYTISDV